MEWGDGPDGIGRYGAAQQDGNGEKNDILAGDEMLNLSKKYEKERSEAKKSLFLRALLASLCSHIFREFHNFIHQD